jgi:2-phospho-L-lactate guanylyltransferase
MKADPSLLFVIPMKDPARSKTRLKPVLSHPVRMRLAMALFRHTLTFIRKACPEGQILVVTASPVIADVARIFGANVLMEEGSCHLSEALAQAASWAERQDFRSICILPADLADPKSGDLETLLDVERENPSVILCPAHDGGTNALVATPPKAIPFRYGYRSAVAHERQAEIRGVAFTRLPLASFAQDIDVASDLHLRLAELPKRLRQVDPS